MESFKNVFYIYFWFWFCMDVMFYKFDMLNKCNIFYLKMYFILIMIILILIDLILVLFNVCYMDC